MAYWLERARPLVMGWLTVCRMSLLAHGHANPALDASGIV